MCVHSPKKMIKMNTKPASGRNAVDRAVAIDQIVADRFLEAIARGTTPDFIDAEIKAADGRMMIGTMLSARSAPNYVGLSAKFMALARYCESRPQLLKHAATLREAGRICATMVALGGSTAEKERVMQVALTDPIERHGLMAQLVRISALPKSEIDVLLPHAVRRTIWATPSNEVVERTMTRARLIHLSLSQGREAEAREAAVELGRDVLAVFMQRAATTESLHVLSQLASILKSLADAGAFIGTNIVSMLEVALEADRAAIEVGGDDPGDCTQPH